MASILRGRTAGVASLGSRPQSYGLARELAALRSANGPRERDPPSADLLGRERECAAIEELLSAVRRADSSTVVLRGEPGIGKTALLRFATERAGRFSVAYAAAEEGISLARDSGNQWSVGFNLVNLALIEACRGQETLAGRTRRKVASTRRQCRNLLDLALAWPITSEHAVLASPPLWLQHAVMRAARPLARLRGRQLPGLSHRP